MYAYADGGAHVLLTARSTRSPLSSPSAQPETALAYLATPTDAYVVPIATAERARAAYRRRGARRRARTGAAEAALGRAAVPPRLRRGRTGGRRADRAAGPQLRDRQAPAALARHRRRGRRTARVVQRRPGDVDPLGDEEPRARRRLRGCRALRDRDLRARDHAGADGGAARARPQHASRAPGGAGGLFSEDAAHGGLWTAAYEPRSALGIAALAGLPASLAGAGEARRDPPGAQRQHRRRRDPLPRRDRGGGRCCGTASSARATWRSSPSCTCSARSA